MFKVGDEVEGISIHAEAFLNGRIPIITSIREGKDLEDTYLRFNGEEVGYRASKFKLVQPFTLENE